MTPAFFVCTPGQGTPLILLALGALLAARFPAEDWRAQYDEDPACK